MHHNNKQQLTVYINNKKVEVKNKYISIIQLCEMLDIYIPRFCYHKKLSIAGNCRMCLVEVESVNNKPVIACSTYLTVDMKIYTKSNLVSKIRENILELLLINHPLDCPICDQGGECDLQDQAMIYGNDRSRFLEKKRSAFDKNLGVFVKSIMTRCIHCTRCIRFCNELVGETQIGMFGRGVHSEIGTYNSNKLNSEIIGNIIDLCPVGALTSKPFSFSARSWELTSIESIDLLDSACSNIRFEKKGNIIMRVTPVINENLNEEWITDKVRFSYDAFKLQRLTTPYIKSIITSKYIACSFEKSFMYIKKNMNFIESNSNEMYDRCYFYTGNLISLESQLTLKMVTKSMGFYNLNLNWEREVDFRRNYLMCNEFKTIENKSLFFLCGINTKIESSLLNIKLKKVSTKNSKIKIIYLGSTIITNYNIVHIGFSSEVFLNIYYGKLFFCKMLIEKKKVSFIGNNSFLPDDNSFNLLSNYLLKNVKVSIDYNYLSLFASEIGLYDHHIMPSLKSKIDNYWSWESFPKLIYLLGSDLLENLKLKEKKNCFIIYQGHHADIGIQYANIILPSCLYVESNGTYINCEGIVKYTSKVLSVPGKALPDNLLTYTLFRYIKNKSIVFESYNMLNNKIEKKIIKKINKKIDTYDLILSKYTNKEYYVEDCVYTSTIRSYYKIDTFSRMSNNISKHLITLKENKLNFK